MTSQSNRISSDLGCHSNFKWLIKLLNITEHLHKSYYKNHYTTLDVKLQPSENQSVCPKGDNKGDLPPFMICQACRIG